MQRTILYYISHLQVVFTKFWFSICDPSDYKTVSNCNRHLPINLANTVLQSSFSVTQSHDSLTYIGILLKKNWAQWSNAVNAISLVFSKPDPWHLQSIHKALVVQEIWSHCGKTQNWHLKLSEQGCPLTETKTGLKRQFYPHQKRVCL